MNIVCVCVRCMHIAYLDINADTNGPVSSNSGFYLPSNNFKQINIKIKKVRGRRSWEKKMVWAIKTKRNDKKTNNRKVLVEMRWFDGLLLWHFDETLNVIILFLLISDKFTIQLKINKSVGDVWTKLHANLYKIINWFLCENGWDSTS